MTGVRGHEPTCPIARETWCIWDGDTCDLCAMYCRGYAAAVADARATVESLPGTGTHTKYLGKSLSRAITLQAIDALKEKP